MINLENLLRQPKRTDLDKWRTLQKQRFSCIHQGGGGQPSPAHPPFYGFPSLGFQGHGSVHLGWHATTKVHGKYSPADFARMSETYNTFLLPSRYGGYRKTFKPQGPRSVQDSFPGTFIQNGQRKHSKLIISMFFERSGFLEFQASAFRLLLEWIQT